jgi:hypothetical protein
LLKSKELRRRDRNYFHIPLVDETKFLLRRDTTLVAEGTVGGTDQIASWRMQKPPPMSFYHSLLTKNMKAGGCEEPFSLLQIE